MDQDILIQNGFIQIDVPDDAEDFGYISGVATVISNLASYGYTVDSSTYRDLLKMDQISLSKWWAEVDSTIGSISARNIEDHVVYKNLPKEVLEMTHCSYVINQFLIYNGMPYENLRQEEVVRPPLGDMSKLRVLTAS